VAEFDLPGAVRRIRRIADMSQRELARAAGMSAAAIGHVEAGTRGLTVAALDRIAVLAGLRIALLDGSGDEATAMAAGAVRDRAGRRFPAHLDTRYGDQDWWHGEHRYAREQPWYTFDRVRYTRDHWRDRTGTPEDHQAPRPGDSPAERRAARQQAARLRREEERRRRRESGAARPIDDVTCACPPRCEELDDWSGRPVHAEDCPCSCDVG
jgi:transcriptional regulator with XRE-family HTH domain